MLGNSIYFWKIIRNITTGFGSIFSNIVIARYNYSTTPWTEQQRLLVKLEEGEKEKYIQALQGDPTNSKKVQITLPIMAYCFLGMEYDKTRKLQTTQQNFNVTSQNTLLTQYSPVPYNFHFQIYIYVRTKIDGEQILEQILPFFTPDYTLNINLIPSMNITQKVPVVLNSITYENKNEGGRETEIRYILWTLDFTVMGQLYGPTNAQGLITEAIINLYDWKDTDGTDLVLLLNIDIPASQGTYLPGEIVFQGKDLPSANATAYVNYWDSTIGRLSINNAKGMFYTNNLLQGVQSGASYNIINYEIIPSIIETITVTANTYNYDILN